jgi:hypothetical protein
MFAFAITSLALHYQTGKLLSLLKYPIGSQEDGWPWNFDRRDINNGP